MLKCNFQVCYFCKKIRIVFNFPRRTQCGQTCKDLNFLRHWSIDTLVRNGANETNSVCYHCGTEETRFCSTKPDRVTSRDGQTSNPIEFGQIPISFGHIFSGKLIGIWPNNCSAGQTNPAPWQKLHKIRPNPGDHGCLVVLFRY